MTEITDEQVRRACQAFVTAIQKDESVNGSTQLFEVEALRSKSLWAEVSVICTFAIGAAMRAALEAAREGRGE